MGRGRNGLEFEVRRRRSMKGVRLWGRLGDVDLSRQTVREETRPVPYVYHTLTIPFPYPYHTLRAISVSLTSPCLAGGGRAA